MEIRKSSTLYGKIEQELETKIINKDLKGGDKVPTETELMDQFSVSRMTARKALDMLVNKKLIERFPGRGSFVLSTDKPKTINHKNDNALTIGAIFPKLAPSFGTEILSNLSNIADEQNVNFLYTETRNNSFEDESRAIQRMRQYADGLIVWPIPGKVIGTEILKLIVDEYPVVLLDRYIQDVNASYIVTDNQEATKKALKYLVQLGHQHICIVPKQNIADTSIQDRVLYAKSFLNSLPEGSSSVLYTHGINYGNAQEIQSEKKSLKGKVISLLKKDSTITAFFVTEYYPATILYQVLIELGYQVPKDFSIICYDYPTFYNESIVRFTHIQQNEEVIAKDAFNMLNGLIKKRSDSVQKLENASLIIGDTTGKPRSN